MRVISGSAKGRVLKTIESLDTRPTSDRVKESLFNILAPVVVRSSVLDLFAGSGALGIEALSRGADSAVFVEQSHKAALIIVQNLTHTGLNNRASVQTTDALRYLKSAHGQFNLILMDPPYHSGLILESLALIDAADLLAPGGRIAAESDDTELLPDAFFAFSRVDRRKYGRAAIHFYRRTAEINKN